jgi:hypothetical protein
MLIKMVALGRPDCNLVNKGVVTHNYGRLLRALLNTSSGPMLHMAF